MLRQKTFKYYGQMINYYNKVCKNPKVVFCIKEVNTKTGYTVSWQYSWDK